jgi:hypothetical protein
VKGVNRVKRFEILFVLMIVLVSSFLLGAAKDIHDSFNKLTIGIIVDDTTAFDATYETPLYNFLVRSGMTVKKIDTDKLNDAAYDGVNNWNTLDLAILCDQTTPVDVDTSLVGGIGDVPIMVLNPAYCDSFGLPDSSGTTTYNAGTPDSIAIGNAGHITSMFTEKDSLPVGGKVGGNIYSFNPPTYTTNVIYYNLALTDTIAVYDTLNSVKRVAWGLSNAIFTGDGGQNYATITHNWPGFTFCRSIAMLAGSSEDSLFNGGYFAPVGDYTKLINYIDNIDRLYIQHLVMNGHTIIQIDTAYGHTAGIGYSNWNWSDLDFVIYDDYISAVDDANLIAEGLPQLTVDQHVPISVWGWSGTPISVTDDSMKIKNGNSKLVDYAGLSLNDILGLMTTDKVFSAIANPGGDGLNIGQTKSASVWYDSTAWAHDKDNRYAFIGYLNIAGRTALDDVTATFWNVLDSTYYWMLSQFPTQPSGLSATALNTDSLEFNWTDNADSEDGYAVFIYQPDSAWWDNTLAASTEIDTVFPFWPPNSEVIWDVAVIEGTDTLFSVDGKDTTYTLAAVPKAPVFVSQSDTELRYIISGYNFVDEFSDSNFVSNPNWSEWSGTWNVIGPDYWLESTGASNNKISTGYDHILNLYRDAIIAFDFQFADTTYLDQQTIRFYFCDDADTLGYNGYLIEIDSTALTLDKVVAGTRTELETYTWDRDFDWHQVKIIYNWSESPQDSSVSMILKYDDTAIDTSTDETFYPSDGDFMGFYASNAGIHLDNIYIQGSTPSANHSLTPYAMENTGTGNYVDFDDDVLESGTIWGWFSDFGGLSVNGDTLSGLSSNTSYSFRIKSKNGHIKD